MYFPPAKILNKYIFSNTKHHYFCFHNRLISNVPDIETIHHSLTTNSRHVQRRSVLHISSPKKKNALRQVGLVSRGVFTFLTMYDRSARRGLQGLSKKMWLSRRNRSRRLGCLPWIRTRSPLQLARSARELQRKKPVMMKEKEKREREKKENANQPLSRNRGGRQEPNLNRKIRRKIKWILMMTRRVL